MSDQFVKDMLLQMQEEQTRQGQSLARIEGDLTSRVKKLEKAQERQWWTTYVITPGLAICYAVARKFGVTV